MLADALTRDNLHLQGLTKAQERAARAVNCTRSWDDDVRHLVEHSVSDSTRTAYASDLRHFEAWGGTLPASPSMVAAYVAACADTLAVATITRRVATLSAVHDALGSNPCRSALVRATLRGLRRTRGTSQRQAKPLLREDLMLLLDATSSTSRDVRDRALLLVGFAGGFRRSELVGLDCGDIEHVRQGIIVTLRRSKTDQEGGGRRIGIPHGRTRHCPVAALDAWVSASGIEEGPIFRPVDRHGHVSPERLSGEAVSLVVRDRVAAVGIDPVGFSGHSLRAGFATSAAQAGVSTMKIRAQTGHASDAMLARYIRGGELFMGNAAGAVL